MLTNHEIRMKTILVSQNLLKIGVKAGDVVAVIVQNHHYVAPVIFACLTILAPVNTLDASFNPSNYTKCFLYDFKVHTLVLRRSIFLSK